MLDLFKSLCLPQKQFLRGAKVEKLLEIMPDAVYEQDVGVIVKCENPKIVLVSHMDLIGLFRSVFEEGKDPCVILEDVIVGALDNTITNAAAILALREVGVENVEFLFSDAEEIGMVGMSNYLKRYPEKARSAFFVNLDVTWEGYREGKNISFEFDRPSGFILNQLKEMFAEEHFTASRMGDDIDAVNWAGARGISVCLPTTGNIHSMQSTARLSSLQPYVDGIIKILKELDVSEMHDLVDKRLV